MRNLILIGSGGHSRPVLSTIQINKKFNLVGIIDLKFNNKNKENILGIPIVGPISFLEKTNHLDTSIFLAIGDNNLRKSLSENHVVKKFELINVIHPLAYIDASCKLGSGNFIGPFAHLGPKSIIGSGNIINTYANVEHEVNVGNFSQIAPGAQILGRCHIGNQVFMGSSSTLIEGLSVADNTTVGAGAVVTKNIIDQGNTYIGVPAKKK